MIQLQQLYCTIVYGIPSQNWQCKYQPDCIIGMTAYGCRWINTVKSNNNVTVDIVVHTIKDHYRCEIVGSTHPCPVVADNDFPAATVHCDGESVIVL